MKKMFSMLFGLVLSFGLMAGALAQTYPYSNPTYLPTAIMPAVAYTAPTTAYSMVLHGIDTASIRITGTCTSLAATVQGSNDSSNWTDITLYPVGGGASVKAISAVGFWRTDVAGFTRVRINATALTASCTFTMAGSQGPAFRQPTDPCADPAVTKASVAVNLGASATTAIVAAATGKTTYVCSLGASAVGTNPTLTFKTGTQTTTPCDTGAANLTGAMIPAAADGMVNLGVGHSLLSSALSGQTCITTGATTSIQGVMTYVQQ